MKNKSQTPIRDEIRSRIPEPRAIEEMIAFAGDAERLLRAIINDLPQNRDWLDPLLEREARALLGGSRA
jgi:hypothetical protein